MTDKDELLNASLRAVEAQKAALEAQDEFAKAQEKRLEAEKAAMKAMAENIMLSYKALAAITTKIALEHTKKSSDLPKTIQKAIKLIDDCEEIMGPYVEKLGLKGTEV